MGRLGIDDLLELLPLADRELRRVATTVFRVQRAEPVSVEVGDHIPDPVLAGERRPCDRGHIHPWACSIVCAYCCTFSAGR